LTEGMGITAGIRFDYENNKLKYNTQAGLSQAYKVEYYGMTIGDTMNSQINFIGQDEKNTFEVLPKLAINYNLNNNIRLYTTASRGFKSGGYNIQMLSDVAQNDLRCGMLNGLKTSISEELSAQGTPQNVIDLILSKMPSFNKIDTAEGAIGNMLWFNPESSWNFEIGGYFNFISDRIKTSLSLFDIEVNDIQLTKFSPNGFGRMLSNSGAVSSRGVEVGIIGEILNNFSISLEYGFSHSTFTDYKDTIILNAQAIEVDYSGNRIPYAPNHTISISADYSKEFNNFIIDKFSANAQFIGAGNIYWDETNELYQSFYNAINARISFGIDKFEFSIWAKNITNSQYNTFYFETLGNNFFQICKPFGCGATINVKF
jgi:outer membrane receptor protein involved in Fe transport